MNQEILSLKRNSPDFDSALMRGKVTRHGELCFAFPREIISNLKEVETVIFEIVRPGDIIKPALFQIWWKAIRPESLTIILTPSVAVLLNGLAHQWSISLTLLALALLGVIFFQIAVNALNDVEDHLRLIDLPHKKGGSGVIQKGWLSAEQLRRFGYVSFFIGLLFGLWPVLENPGILFAVGGMGGLGVISYSNKLVGMKYRSWGNLSIFFLLGPLLCVGLSQAAFGQFDFSTVSIGSFFGFTAFGIYYAKTFQDRFRETIYPRLDFKSYRHLFVALYALSYFSLFIGIFKAELPWTIGFGLVVGLPAVVRFLQRVYKASGPVSVLLVSLKKDSLSLHFYLGALVCLSLFAELILIKK